MPMNPLFDQHKREPSSPPVIRVQAFQAIDGLQFKHSLQVGPVPACGPLNDAVHRRAGRLP